MFLGDPGAEFLCGKLRIGPKKEKRTKKTERLVGTVGAAIRASRVVSMVVRKRMPERSRVSRC